MESLHQSALIASRPYLGEKLMNQIDQAEATLCAWIAQSPLPKAHRDKQNPRHEQRFKEGLERLERSAYLESMKALAQTALLRLLLALAWFALLSPLILFIALDALCMRALRFESYAASQPTLYKTALSLPGFLLGLGLLLLLVPTVIPSWVGAFFYLAFLVSVHTLITHFHQFE